VPNDACTTYGDGSGLFHQVLCGAPPLSLMLDSVDTVNNCPLLLPLPNATVCVVRAGTITMGSVTAAAGAHPLVLIADQLILSGTITVTAGAGVDCQPAAIGVLGGGGAGASNYSRGGNGGAGTGSAAVAAGRQSVLTTIGGGCPGGNGDKFTATTGAGGTGGGALYLIGTVSIQITDNVMILAGGQPGHGGTGNGGGGGGGGTGGLIAFDTPTVGVGSNVTICANGGAGGGGAGTGSAHGNAGAPGCTTLGAAAGGSGVNSGGAGGNGAYTLDATAGGSGSTPAGAGGGGGGAGWVRLYGGASLGSAAVSPNPQ
jgi:hypothetical protein